MKARTRLVALLLALIMIISCAPLSIFANETTLKYESELYTDEALNSYKQYEAMWNDPTYVKADVKYTVYFDTENATKTRDVVFYVINWNDEGIGRIGTDSDIDIVTDLITAPASVESGNRWAVVVVDFGGNPLSKAPNIEMSLAYLRDALTTLTKDEASKFKVWSDDTHTTTTTIPVHKNHVYVLPAGYRVARDIPYFETDFHATLGTRNYVLKGWGSHIAGKKTVYYAYHTGNAKCTFDHAANANVECIAGAPQEINGKVVAYAAGHLAPKVTRYEDMRKPDGSPLDYICRLDIIYPSGEDPEATPVMVQAATQSPRMSNVGTVGSDDYDKDGTSSLKVRAMLVGMEFSGYTVAVYDYAYSPMARGDHYGYIDPYGAHYMNAAKTSRAAIRCIRYFAEEYGYDDTRIGAAGISKGTPTVAVLSTFDNKYVEEAGSEKYDIDGNGPGEAINTQGLWYEGDINAEGVVTTESTTVVQPYMTYEAGYNGKNINGADVNYNVTRTGEISSEINVAYCAAGDGINRVYKGGQSIILGGTNPTTGKETQHVPMILSCGYYDEYGCWDHWPGIQKRFTEYAENPFIAIGMEDMGHDYPSGIDPMRDYDRYNAYMQFLHSILKPELYTPQVAWIMPVDGATDVSVESDVQVQLVKPAESLEAFVAATTVKDDYGNSVEGAWATNAENTSGLYTFTPANDYMGGIGYTVTVGTPVVAQKTTKSFTVDSAGFLRPVADTYISAANKAGVFGTADTLYIDNQRTYLATFKTADFEDANKAYLNLDLMGAGNQTLSVYLLDGFEVDESKTNYNNTPSLSEDKLIGTYNVSEGESKLDLLGIAATVKEEYFTLAISGSAHYYEENFESYTKTTSVGEYDNNVVDSSNSSITHYYSHADAAKVATLKTRRNGDLSTPRQIKNVSGDANKPEMALSILTKSSVSWGGILKFYNTLNDSVITKTSDIVGKTFNYSISVKYDSATVNGATGDASTLSTKPKVEAGIIRSSNKEFLTSNSAGYSILKDNGWHTISGAYTVNASHVAELVSSNERYSYPMFGVSVENTGKKDDKAAYTYFIDDIIVSEVAPSALVSKENTTTFTAYITTETINESVTVADTYVSKAQPDIAFGNSDRLLLNGGEDENVMFLTFSSKLVEDKTNIQFTIPAENKASVETEILLLDGYYVNEDTLTYNTMPDLTNAVSLGKYTLTGGINTVEFENVTEKISGAYFTLVLKTDDAIEFVYSKNFEDYALGDDVNDTSHNETDTETTNSAGKNYTYYYAHLPENMDSKMYIARTGGAAVINNPLGNVLTDPANDGNQAIDLKLSTNSGSTYNGRLKIYNSIADYALTTTDALVGQTLRFSARIKANSQKTIENGCSAYACVMLSAGSSVLTDNNKNQIKSEAVRATDEWQTVIVDYTVNAKDIKVATTASNLPVWVYPMFTLEFNNTKAGNSYLIDDLTVVKLDSDGTVSRIDIASSEGATAATDTIMLRARNEKDPVADTYVNELDKAGVFGFEKNAYVDSKRTYLATFKTSDFTDTDKAYIKLPFSGTGSQTLSVYLLDSFKVDEAKTNYNNTPELSSDKLVGTYTATGGEKQIGLKSLISKVSGEYFTIAIKGTAHYFELNFEDYTADTNVNMYDHNEVDSVDTDRSHMHAFAPEGKLTPLTTRLGGSLGTRKITTHFGEMVLRVPTDTAQTYGGYLKFYNSLNYTAATDELVGKTFNYSVNVKLDSASNTLAEAEGVTLIPKVTVGVMRTGANAFLSSQTLTFDDLKEDNNGWKTLSGSYTVAAAEIGKKMTSEWKPKNRYSYPIFGMFFESLGIKNGTQYVYYTDDIVVYEEAPNTIASLDSNGTTTVILTGVSVVADTYVSRANPDVNYGDATTLRFGDEGGDKKALVLSFMNDVLDDDSYVELNLNNSGAAIKDVSVYYVLDYLANESTLTWNTMPEYEANLLGVYDFAEGDNRIDLSALRGKLTGENFTLVLRTESHSYLENFESYAKNYKYYDSSSKDNNEQDPDVSTNIFYHGFTNLTGMSRRGGNLENRYVIADASNENNQILKVPTYSKSGDGRLKFYNSINYEPINDESDIVGKTLRFSFKAKADVANCNSAKLSTLSLNAGAMTSWTNANIKVINISSSDLQSGWKTYTVDYTVSANDVGKLLKGDSWATGKPVSQNYTSFPMFGINFGDDDTTGSHVYLIDDLSVVELVDGAPVGDAIFASKEAEGDVSLVSAFDGNTTIIETTVSSASNGDVISIVDSTETHSLLRAEDGKLIFGNTILCDELGNDIVLTEAPVKVVAIYDDVKGTVRFAVGDYLAYYKDGEGAVHVTFEHLVIDGGVSDKADFGVSGMKASKLNNTTSEIIGFQTNDLENAVRFISGVDTIYYNAIGFTLESATNTKTLGSSTVYSSIIADDKDVFAKDYGYNLMSVLAIKDVKNGGVIKVTPFLRIGTNYIYGETVFYKITTSNGISVSEVDESEFTAPTNANLASVTVDGEPIVGFSADVTEYNVPASNLNAMNIAATTARPEATFSIEQNGNVATITVTAFNGKTQKTYTFIAYEKVETAVVNKNGANAIVTYVFDDGSTSSATIVTELADKYPSFTGSFALITNKLATLSTIEGDPNDGLLEYEFDENGDYVYTKNETVWNYWANLFNKYGDRGLEGVNHTHTHKYIGENDNGGAFEYRSTAGNVYTSDVFPIGNVRKEYYASNQILRELGQRALVMVGAGLSADDGKMIDYTDNYKALPMTSGAFIGKRKTVNSPTKPADMVNLATEFLSDDNRFNIKAYMIQHYATSATAPKNTSAEGYSKQACLDAGITYWTDYIDKAVEMGEWAAFCFHNVVRDTHTKTDGHFVFETQADAMFKYTDDLSKENKVWVANFTDACLYMFERSTAEVGAYIDTNGDVVVSLNDKENDEIFTMPLTVKVALPTEKTVAKLGETALNTFTDNGKTYVYVDIIPGNSVTITVE